MGDQIGIPRSETLVRMLQHVSICSYITLSPNKFNFLPRKYGLYTREGLQLLLLHQSCMLHFFSHGYNEPLLRTRHENITLPSLCSPSPIPGAFVGQSSTVRLGQSRVLNRSSDDPAVLHKLTLLPTAAQPERAACKFASFYKKNPSEKCTTQSNIL